jgi:excisionase family DNA binding protein
MALKTLTRKEVAERLGVTRQRVHQFIKEGRLPAQQVGPRRYIVDESDLKQLTPGKMGRPPIAGVVNGWEGCLLKEEMLRFEADLIKRALEAANGHISPAARLLGLSHQALAAILQGRHKNLLSARTPVLKRKRSIIRTSSRKRFR